jgi:hypothetical protein
MTDFTAGPKIDKYQDLKKIADEAKIKYEKDQTEESKTLYEAAAKEAENYWNKHIKLKPQK